ncbi:MAG: hypothetical protein ACD_68C00109G0003 [uncultured bacterium]|nr:MAG: hypothetical protein ACD_68C00109G0003 [uncultured bacterium]
MDTQTINLITLILLAIIFVWQIYLTLTVKKYLTGKKQLLKEAQEQGVDQVLIKHQKAIKQLQARAGDLQEISEQISRVAAKSITKVGVVRFNPFGDTGGNQSFAISLLDSKSNGLVLSSLFGREGTRVYCKEVKGGLSEFPLSEEEKQSIAAAQYYGVQKELEFKNNN